MTVADRFWSKVRKLEGENACWVFVGTVRKRTSHVLPYGQFRHRGQMRPAHRVAWELTNGPVPEGKNVLHGCDNPPCVRPSHLHLGTHQENMDEMAERGRRAAMPGAANPRAQLTDAQVQEIREAFAFGEGAPTIAARYGIGTSQAYRIRDGKAWREPG